MNHTAIRIHYVILSSLKQGEGTALFLSFSYVLDLQNTYWVEDTRLWGKQITSLNSLKNCRHLRKVLQGMAPYI